jgi:hypothetical protein
MEDTIKLKRFEFTEKSTIGQLIFDDFKCFTLEDKDRELKIVDPLSLIKIVKVQNKTCIPYGKYEVTTTFSNRFKKVMPLLLDVPGFAGIRIHSGNTSEDTEGCILLGTTYSKDFVGNSRQAYLEFINHLNKRLELGKNKVFIEITK